MCVNSVQEQGVPLASNQVQFSLLYRKHEKEGLLKTAKRLGVSVIAYSPLSQGLLTGVQAASDIPEGPEILEDFCNGTTFMISPSNHSQCILQFQHWLLCRGNLHAKDHLQEAEVA